jgi:ectoine hydroxylase-related dioxygenase (phytanoyl-CoA dioxygenase family)
MNDDRSVAPGATPVAAVPESHFARPVSHGVPRLDFDRATLPWLDRPARAVDDYLDQLAMSDTDRLNLRARLLHWSQMGFVVLKKVIDPRLIDAYVADVEDLFRERRHAVLLDIEGYGETHAKDATPEMLGQHHMRLMDFHNLSIAGKKIAMHSTIIDFLRHLFQDTPVAMQSLTFIHGTEQQTHQDYAYVVPAVSSHLAASWVALEDVHADAGPLAYFPGSHVLPKFDWGNGLTLNAESTFNELDFAHHIEREAERMGLRREVFIAEKGDVFVWHAALAHAGSPVKNRDFTRKSLVTHYSSLTGYPRDRRCSDREPIVFEMNGGLIYGDPRWPEDEDSFRRGENL